MSCVYTRSHRNSLRALLLASAALTLSVDPSFAQVSSRTGQDLPPVNVEAPRVTPRARSNAQPTRAPQAQPQQAVSTSQDSKAAMTSPSADQALRDIQRVPGGVALVPAESYKNNSIATTIKDVLDYVPGVFAQPKWGEDTRLSVRGSGLSRNFHLRGVQLYMDSIPINTADGYGDFQEIDPSAYKYVEVFKGGNALRFGANSLGGAINFVTPTGRDPGVNSAAVDIGSFNTRRFQASAGGTSGAWDGFITASNQESAGFRDHSGGHATRMSGNIGYQASPDFETRFYLNANEVRQQIPGSVTRQSALTQPTVAAVANVVNDQQRNIDTVRVANKTTIRFDATTVEFGAFAVDRHLMHPIFQWLDYQYKDYGGFVRATDERLIGGFRNRLIAGVNVINGSIDNQQFTNLGGAKGALQSSSIDKSKNTSAYLENAFYFLPSVAAIGGTQFLYATRNRQDRFLSNGDQSAASEFNIWSPKGGLLWDIDPTWQAFANISRSAEVPSFGEGAAAIAIPFNLIRPQKATTYEIGTRGRRPDLTWELTGYRANIRDELQCLTTVLTPGSCNVVNADRTIHQGIEAGLGIAVFRNIFSNVPDADRLWINVAYTYNDFRFDNDAVYGNNQLPGAPRHYLRGEMLYKHANGFYIGPNVEWVPQAYFVDSANTLSTEAYALLGAKAGVDDGKIAVYLEARNILNKAYIASASIIDRANAASPLFEPGTGRAVYAGMRMKW